MNCKEIIVFIYLFLIIFYRLRTPVYAPTLFDGPDGAILYYNSTRLDPHKLKKMVHPYIIFNNDVLPIPINDISQILKMNRDLNVYNTTYTYLARTQQLDLNI